MLEVSDTVRVSLTWPISVCPELWKVWGQSTCALPHIALSVDQAQSVIDMTGRLLGHLGFTCTKMLRSMETKHNPSQAKGDIITSVAWLHLWEHHFKWPDLFPWGKIVVCAKSQIFIIIILSSSFSLHDINSRERTIPRWETSSYFDGGFPIISKSGADCLLTLFHRVGLSFPLWDAVWVCHGALLALLGFFVGCFHLGMESQWREQRGFERSGTLSNKVSLFSGWKK